MAQHADKFASGVISNVEASYSRFEAALTQTLRMPNLASSSGKERARGGKKPPQAQPPRRKQPRRRAKSGAQAQGAAAGLAQKGGVAKPRPRTALLWGS
jgi:hypothetical protein